jgi:hypothetical protein
MIKKEIEPVDHQSQPIHHLTTNFQFSLAQVRMPLPLPAAEVAAVLTVSS